MDIVGIVVGILLRYLRMKPVVVTLPITKRKRCPNCKRLAAMVDTNTTACVNCGATIRVSNIKG